MDLDFIRGLVKPAETKIAMIVMDGLGGLPRPQDDLTELEAASTPNLDALASRGVCGLHLPIAHGITPGSGPAHLSLFGYDPIRYQVGRGVLSALGVDFDLQPGDVAARGNFCTLDEDGRVTDRRAGRIPTEQSAQLCELLDGLELPGAEVFVRPEKEHRFLLVLRGPGLSGAVGDTDPQETGREVKPARPAEPAAETTARLVDLFGREARRVLQGRRPANGVLLRGFSQRPTWPTFADAFGLRAAAIAAYPMYRGVAKLLGMAVLPTGQTMEEEFVTLAERWREFDFFYLHIKPVDSAGEDGDFDRKVALIERVDNLMPHLIDLGPEVIVVTGDHSTPAPMGQHSWHPVPLLIWSPRCRLDGVRKFGERACLAGALGPYLPATKIMPLALANAGRLEKFGA